MNRPKPGLNVNATSFVNWVFAILGYSILLWAALGALFLLWDYTGAP